MIEGRVSERGEVPKEHSFSRVCAARCCCNDLSPAPGIIMCANISSPQLLALRRSSSPSFCLLFLCVVPRQREEGRTRGESG